MTPTTNIHEAEQQDAAVDVLQTGYELRAALIATSAVIFGTGLYALVAYLITAGVQS